MKIVIILLLIFAVITLSIILLIDHDNERYVDTKKTKKDYRLGDIVKYNRTNKWGISKDYVNKYPGTIGREYAHLTSKQNDIDTLTEIVQKRLKSYPKKSYAIHLRLGDVLCIPNNDKEPISAIDFSNIINKLCPENQIKVLFYGNHTGMCIDKSKQYIDVCVSNIPNLVISANQDADDDFCTMINSQNFIAGKGGLSELVVSVRKKLGRYSIVDDRISGYTIKNKENYEGNFAHLKVLEKLKREKLKTKSQFNQDLFVLEHHNHKKNGFYLEIGVHDGENNSNTSLLDQEYNWKGVCIDPFMSGMKNRSCQQFNVALGTTPGKTQFRLGGGLSGIDKFVTSTTDNKMWANQAKNFEKTTVNVRTPEDVFKEANMPHIIDYLSLDVEGAEMDILKSFPFDKYCIKYATIETNNDKDKEKELEEFMRKREYKFEGHYKVDHIFSNNCNYRGSTLGNYTTYFLNHKNEFFGENGHEFLLSRLKRLLSAPPDTLLMDVGANVGNYTKHLRELSQKGCEILSIEPNPVNIMDLEKQPNIHIYRKALSDNTDKGKTLPLYNWKDSSKNEMGNGLSGLRSGGEKICDVEITTVESILSNYKKKIWFVKIDTEGHELEVLRGFGPYLKTVEHIIFECGNTLDDHRGPGISNPFHQIVDLLHSNGLNVYHIGTKRLIPVSGKWWSDIYEKNKYWSNCYATRMDIHKLVDSKHFYFNDL